MKQEENICEYFERIDELVNVVQGLGETVLDSKIVDKVLRTLPLAYNPKVSTLEDRENISSLTLDELYGILIAYERISLKKKQLLKYSRRQRIKNQNFNPVLKKNLMMKKKPIS